MEIFLNKVEELIELKAKKRSFFVDKNSMIRILFLRVGDANRSEFFFNLYSYVPPISLVFDSHSIALS
jgi:hypothetical protein